MKRRNKKQLPQPKPQLLSYTGNTLLDIIIPVRGRFDLLAKCLEAIPNAFQDIAYNVVIVDNNSADPVVPDHDRVKPFYAEMTRLYPELTVIYQKENLGFPRACNVAVRRKNSPLLFFLNSDVLLDSVAGNNLIRAMDNPMVGVAGMKLRFASEGDYMDASINPSIRPAGRLQHICLSVNYMGEVYHPFLGWEIDHPRINALTSVFAVTGAALMVRRNSFIKAGGFYEGYGLGTFEDVDLCMMIREQKQDVITVPAATGIHYTGATMEQLQTGYPMQTNASIFNGRWGDKLLWWDYFVL